MQHAAGLEVVHQAGVQAIGIPDEGGLQQRRLRRGHRLLQAAGQGPARGDDQAIPGPGPGKQDGGFGLQYPPQGLGAQIGGVIELARIGGRLGGRAAREQAQPLAGQHIQPGLIRAYPEAADPRPEVELDPVLMGRETEHLALDGERPRRQGGRGGTLPRGEEQRRGGENGG
jgi:hypothetical protein